MSHFEDFFEAPARRKTCSVDLAAHVDRELKIRAWSDLGLICEVAVQVSVGSHLLQQVRAPGSDTQTSIL